MSIFFLILIIVASVALAFFVLVQNPKGGGLSGSIAGFSNQFMGVKQTTDVLEKGTWIFATVVALLCLLSAVFIKSGPGKANSAIDKLNTNSSTAAPMAPVAPPANAVTVPGVDSTAK